ncbi:MAG: DMT family transporter [Acinetobacter sp.]
MIYLTLASFLWGTSFIAGKFAYQSLDPFLLVQLRMMVASIFILALSFKNIRQMVQVFHHNRWRFILLSFLIYPATFLLQFLGLKYTSASSATTMIGIEPLMIVLLGYIFVKKHTTQYDWILATVAFLGVGMVVGSSQNNSDISVLGCSLVLLATIVVATWVLLSKKMLKHVDGHMFTCITICLGSILCLPFTLSFSDLNMSHITVSSFISVLYLGIGCSFLAAKLWNIGLNRFSANRSGIFLALEPVFGVLLSVILLNEHIDGISLVGILIVIIAAFLSQIIKIKA